MKIQMDKAHFITNFSASDKTYISPSSFLVASNWLTTSPILRVSGYIKHCLPESEKFISAKIYVVISFSRSFSRK